MGQLQIILKVCQQTEKIISAKNVLLMLDSL